LSASGEVSLSTTASIGGTYYLNTESSVSLTASIIGQNPPGQIQINNISFNVKSFQISKAAKYRIYRLPAYGYSTPSGFTYAKSYSDSILMLGASNRVFTLTFEIISSAQLESLLQQFQAPSLQLSEVDGTLHLVAVKDIQSITFTGGLVQIYEVQVEFVELNA